MVAVGAVGAGGRIGWAGVDGGEFLGTVALVKVLYAVLWLDSMPLQMTMGLGEYFL